MARRPPDGGSPEPPCDGPSQIALLTGCSEPNPPRLGRILGKTALSAGRAPQNPAQETASGRFLHACALGTARGSVGSATVGVRRPWRSSPRSRGRGRLAPARIRGSRLAARARARPLAWRGDSASPGMGLAGGAAIAWDGPAWWERIYVIRRREPRPELTTVQMGGFPTTTESGETGKGIIPGRGRDEARPRPCPCFRNMDPFPLIVKVRLIAFQSEVPAVRRSRVRTRGPTSPFPEASPRYHL